MLNPYAKYLGNRNPQQIMSETPARLELLLHQIGTSGIEKSLAPGKWTAREILCHLADFEIAFGFRLRQTLAEDNHTIQPFDQEKWAETYAGYDAALALSVFTAVRRWNILLTRTAGPGALSRPVSHPERGTMTFSTILETMAGHDLNHLQQLDAIAANVSSV